MSRFSLPKAACAALMLSLTALPAMADMISEKFAAYDNTNTQIVDYSPMATFMGAYCTETSKRTACAYGAIDQRGKIYLSKYETYLSRIPVSTLNKDEQLAFWLNTRNLLIVHAIADARNSRTIKNGRGTFDAPGDMWTEKRITVEGQELSIDDIERYILLENFDNPNVIYGMYQGTKSGPALHSTGFRGATVQAELAALGEAFVNSRDGLRVRRDTASLNAIYDWYAPALFDGDEQALREHLASFASGKRAQGLAQATGFSTAKFSYSTDNYVIRQQTPQARIGQGGGAAVASGGS